ncbi:hypothetical protein LSH36_444g02044 [Paralvinella palmiformis]|uniref:Uncharacterized protein n=1 Tax=Paralvinella palmiformis TaxID=53620 RepID=A0AAD9JBN0_9ANNE|nr:hypothetical protein LSH36_444g02044 [Paralvinella palmiformis]
MSSENTNREEVPSTLSRKGTTHSVTLTAPTGELNLTEASLNLTQPSSSSLLSILTSKRLAKQFVNKMHARRTERSSSGSRLDFLDTGATYRMAPRVMFAKRRVLDVMEDVVSSRMSGFLYTASRATTMIKALSEEIREKVKELNFDRYKIVCLVSIGQTRGQGLRITSRCTWDVTYDDHCTYTWTNGLAFCTATVYGLYHE